jgi:hypothetical protein
MSSGITHYNKVSGVNGLYVGANDAEIQVATAAGAPLVAGVAVTSSAAELNILTGVTTTAAELNKNDISAQLETIAAAGAVSVVLKNSNLALVGAGAVTLAAPDASMRGVVKTIEMTVDNGDVTLALTNVAGGSAANTCTWSAVGQALILVGGTAKWAVCSESGVALT